MRKRAKAVARVLRYFLQGKHLPESPARSLLVTSYQKQLKSKLKMAEFRSCLMATDTGANMVAAMACLMAAAMAMARLMGMETDTAVCRWAHQS